MLYFLKRLKWSFNENHNLIIDKYGSFQDKGKLLVIHINY